MGVWNAHTSVGNICGSLIAASVLDYGWGWSFVAPGALIVSGGIIVFLFLAPYPEDVGFSSSSSSSSSAAAAVQVGDDKEALVHKTGDGALRQASVDRKGIGLVEACMIPGVIPFALCLFFAKLVAYTFLYWLPFYLTHTGND